ncbi:hypothetical protein [Paenibacillus marinisediminis]
MADEPDKPVQREGLRPESADSQQHNLSLEERAAMDAFLREHPHLKQASPAWQQFYYRVRAAILSGD